MDLQAFNERRTSLNQTMADADPFFREFADLDERAYVDGTIPKPYKELIGLAISVATRCPECVTSALTRFRRHMKVDVEQSTTMFVLLFHLPS